MEKIIALLENYVEADEITAESSFVKELGLSSFDIVCLVSDMNKEFNIQIKPQDFIKYKTVGELAEYIGSLTT